MLPRELSKTIPYLAREGEQIATLARRFGLSRHTVYHHLARATAAPAPPARRPSALDAFRDDLRTRLKSFDLPAPCCSASSGRVATKEA